MNFPSRRPSMHWLTKTILLVIVGGLAFIGLVGLVLPIIPGLIFLFLAVLLLAKVSTRFDSLASRHSGFRQLRQRWRTLNMLRMQDRIKLGFWYCAGALIRGVESGVQTLRQWLQSRASSQ